MAFEWDERVAAELDGIFGEYLTTFVSQPTGEVRANIFREPKRVIAHVSFPTGSRAGYTSEPFVQALWDYAEESGVADRFGLVFAE